MKLSRNFKRSTFSAGFLISAFAVHGAAQAAHENPDKPIVLSHTEILQLDESFGHLKPELIHTQPAHVDAQPSDHVEASPQAIVAGHNPHPNHEQHGTEQGTVTLHHMSHHHNSCGDGHEGSTRKISDNIGIKYDVLFGPTFNEHVGFLDTELRALTTVKLGQKKLCTAQILEFDGNPNFLATGGRLASSMLTEGIFGLKVLPNTYAGVIGSVSSKRGQFNHAVGVSVTHILDGDFRLFAHYAPNGAFARFGIRGLMPGEKIPLIREVKFLRELGYDVVLDCNAMNNGQFQKPVCSVRANINKQIFLRKIFGKHSTFIGCGVNTAAESYRRPSLVTCNFKFELAHG
jgi:hypothetical protein